VFRRKKKQDEMNVVSAQEVFMYSGLERERMDESRPQNVGWVWTKARNIAKSRTNSTHEKLTASVLLTSDYDSDVEEISSWRESLAAFNHRRLAKQICDQFYDLSILTERCGTAENAFVPKRSVSVEASSCAEEAKTQLMKTEEKKGFCKRFKARILNAVLPRRQHSAVLLSIRSRAA
jgi:hypothetical protein